MDYATMWYGRAEQSGSVDARFRLGEILYDGVGVGRDAERAARLFLSAAKHGHVRAMLRAAKCYEAAEGVEKHDPAGIRVDLERE